MKRVVLPFLVVAAAFATDTDLRLPEAAMAGDASLVRSLVSQKAPVNAALPDGTTALHWMVRTNDLETSDLLLRGGANPKASDKHGVTPIYLACVNGSAAMVSRLLDAGADPNSADPTGETALMTAAKTGNPDALKVLVDHGARVNDKDGKSDQTALMWAVRENHLDAVRFLLARGAEVNARTKLVTDLPPMAGNLQGVGRAQNSPKGAPPGAMTPLLYAARDGRLDIAQVLAASGANVNQAEANGTTPLVIAIINNHLDVARFLLDHGADANAADGFGRAPLWSTVDLRNLDLDSRTSENGIDRAPAFDLIKALLDHGADPNAELKVEPPSRRWMLPFGASQWVTIAGQTPFIRAALAGDVAVMRLLLEKGADPNRPAHQGTTALMAAAGVGWVITQTYTESKESLLEAVKLCVEKAGDVNAVNGQGFTAMHGAANRGSDDIIQFLASKGARVDVKDGQGRTPMTYAEGVYLAGKPPERRTSTIALLKGLTK
jgi:ankyrin repeat protein